MSIKSYVDELEKLNIEIKRNSERNKRLKKRVKELEKYISEYIVNKNQIGLKYNGSAILVEKKETRVRKKKKEKEESVLSLLKELGVSNPKNAYKLLQNAQKGNSVDTCKIKIKKIVKK